MWKTTVKGLLAHKLRFLLTALAVTLGVAFMAGTMVLTDTMQASFDSLFADVNEGTDAVVRQAESFDGDFGETQRPNVPAHLLDEVRSAEGVAAAEGNVEGFAQFVDKDGDPMGNPDMGAPTLGMAWPEVDDLNPLTLVEGRAPESGDEVVMDRGTAKEGDFAVGERVQVLSKSPTREFTISGIVRFGEADSPLGASLALFTPETAQELVGTPGTFNAIHVVAEEGVSEEELAANLREVAPEGTEVLTGADFIAEGQSDVQASLAFFSTFLLTFALIALFVGSFIIYNTFSIVVAQRTKELALLRALGASRRQVIRSVLGEAIVVGMLASAVGIVAGIGVAIGLKGLLGTAGFDMPDGSIVLGSGTIIISLLVGTIVTIVAAMVPARRASRVPPVAAMRDVAVESTVSFGRRTAIGVAITAVGAGLLSYGLWGNQDNAVALVGLGALIVFLGIAALGPVIALPMSKVFGAPLPRLKGMAGTLAKENAARNPKRTAATAAALMIGVGLVGFITIFASSAKSSINDAVDDAFRTDLVLQGGFTNGVSPQLAQDVAEVEGVGAVSPIRTGLVEIEGGTKSVSAVEGSTIEELFDIGFVEGSAAALDDDGLAVYTGVAEDRGWAIGDTIPVRFADTGTTDLTLVGTYERKEIAGNYVISLDTHAANFETQTDFAVYVNIADGADADEVRSGIESIVDARYPNVEVQDQAEFKEAQAAQVNTMLNLIYGLLALAIIIALIGIANTLALSIFERTRELGLLRAVGMTRTQLRSSVRWESVIIALLGTALGLVVSVFFGWAVVQALESEGFRTFTIPGGQLFVVVLLAAMAGVLAAIGPARRASRLDVLTAISHE